jgi:predicted nucleic acid-binding protein
LLVDDSPTAMRVYLDTCCLQRPLDTKSHPRIAIEAEAVLFVLRLCEIGALELVGSHVLAFEMERNPNPTRRDHGLQALGLARTSVEPSPEMECMALGFQEAGLDPLDALHLASAEYGEADFFCTCDDDLLRKARNAGNLRVKVASPLELAQELGR